MDIFVESWPFHVQLFYFQFWIVVSECQQFQIRISYLNAVVFNFAFLKSEENKKKVLSEGLMESWALTHAKVKVTGFSFSRKADRMILCVVWRTLYITSVEMCPVTFPSSLLLPFRQEKKIARTFTLLFKLLRRSQAQGCFTVCVAVLTVRKNPKCYFWWYIQGIKSECINNL